MLKLFSVPFLLNILGLYLKLVISDNDLGNPGYTEDNPSTVGLSLVLYHGLWLQFQKNETPCWLQKEELAISLSSFCWLFMFFSLLTVYEVPRRPFSPAHPFQAS